jgi:gluconokinase
MCSGEAMTADAVIVGLDVGTTGVKAVAFGVGSPWRRVAIREYPMLHPAPGEQVQDLAVILAAARAALTECVAGLDVSRVLAIAVSAAMHGLIALDERREPLTPLLTWADARAGEQARALHADGAARRLQAITGAPVHPMTPLVKLRWFAERDRRTWAAAQWWIGLKDYVLMWLTGRLVTELSSASGTGLLDMATRDWSPVALAACGVSIDRLPEICPTTEMLPLAPSIGRQVGLAPGTPVVLGAADGPLANLGTGAVSPGVAGVSLGTSGAVRIATDRPRPDASGGLFCYAMTEDSWVLGAAISNGGSVARWAGGALAPDLSGDAPVLNLAAGVPPGSDGLVMLPYLLDERAPLWELHPPGAYVGLRSGHTRAHLVRAAVEGVGAQLRLIVDRIDALQPITSVRVTGGAFRSPLWRDVVAGMLARPLYVVDAAEGTALGAAALGLYALGRASRLDEAVEVLTGPNGPQPAPHEPDPALVESYDALRARVPDLVRRLVGAAEMFERGGAAGPAAGDDA